MRPVRRAVTQIPERPAMGILTILRAEEAATVKTVTTVRVTDNAFTPDLRTLFQRFSAAFPTLFRRISNAFPPLFRRINNKSKGKCDFAIEKNPSILYYYPLPGCQNRLKTGKDDARRVRRGARRALRFAGKQPVRQTASQANGQSGRQPVRQTASQADSFTTIMPRRYSRGHVIDPAEAQETEYRKLKHRKLKHRKPKHRRPDTGVLL